MDNVVVAVRCRPPTDEENHEFLKDYFDEANSKTVITCKNKYEFNHVFDQTADQEDVYDAIARPIIIKLLQGYSATILAYGQTGSGKTFTMGTEFESGIKGITQMVLEELFETENVHVKISVTEIYKEEVYDLLSGEPPTKCKIIAFKAVGLIEKWLNNISEARCIMQTAARNRRVGATVANKKSSRSHAIVTISIINKTGQLAKLNLVDLAGSERVGDKGSLRDEGIAINKGLFELQRTVFSLANNENFNPFRNSSLTAILKDTLGKDKFISLIACFSPKASDADETEKTLDFASKFGKITVTPQFNTPFKTPAKFTNKTYCASSQDFKKPLAPLNNTVATPELFSRQRTDRREPSYDFLTPLPFKERGSSDIFNLSSCSTSTQLPDVNEIDTEDNAFEGLIVGNGVVSTRAIIESHLEKKITETVNKALKRQEEILNRNFKQQVLHLLEWTGLTGLIKKNRIPSLAERLARASSPSADDNAESDDDSFGNMTVVCAKEEGADANIRTIVSSDSDLHRPESSSQGSLDGFKAPKATVHNRKRKFSKSSEITSDELERVSQDRQVSNRPKYQPRRSSRLSLKPIVQTNIHVAEEAPAKKKKVDRRSEKVENKDFLGLGIICHRERVLKILQSGETKDLVKLPTIGPKTASVIMTDRLLYGPIKDFNRISEIRGLSKTFTRRFLFANNINDG